MMPGKSIFKFKFGDQWNVGMDGQLKANSELRENHDLTYQFMHRNRHARNNFFAMDEHNQDEDDDEMGGD